jgi:hypothetical protein
MRRWLVERFFAWIQWQRRILIRWESTPTVSLALSSLPALLSSSNNFEIGSTHWRQEAGQARLLCQAAGSRADRFVPYQDRDLLRYSLGAADAHWLSLKPELEGLIVPSKFYGIAAAGRPLIAITASNGEIARLVRQYGCGVVIDPGDARALVRALVMLSTDEEKTAAMDTRARAMLDAYFTRRHAFERWRTCSIQSNNRPKRLLPIYGLCNTLRGEYRKRRIRVYLEPDSCGRSLAWIF